MIIKFDFDIFKCLMVQNALVHFRMIDGNNRDAIAMV